MSGSSRRGTWPWRRRAAGRRRGVAGAVSVLLLSGLMSAGAMPAGAAHAAAAPPKVPQSPSVHGMNLTHFAAPRMPAMVPDAVAQRAWPAARSAVVGVAAALPAGLAAAARAGAPAARVTAPGTPVFVQPASTATHGPTSVAVTVASHGISQKLGITGVVFSVAARQGSGKVTVGLDYKSFAGAYGGNFGERLRLVELPACALTTPQLGRCEAQRPVRGAVNLAGQQAATATVTLPAAGPAMVLAATTTTYTTGNSDGGDGGGAAGSYTATTLKPSGSWSAGGSNGDFTYSYPIAVPPAASAMAPSISLSYDAGSLDGQTAATQAQGNWLGDGWSTPDNFIEQSYKPCADNPEGVSPAPPATNDECYDGQVLSLSLNGLSTSIVADSSSGTTKYVLQEDNGDVLSKVTGSNNGSGTHDTSYWVVTDRSGTSYYFGRNELPGWASGDATTNSVDSEPVFATKSGDPCYSMTWASSVCTLAYRWNLDYVTDAHGNAMAWYYHQNSNAYLENAAKTYTTMPNANATYVRESYLTRIDYGFTAGNAYTVNGGHAPDQVTFTAADSAISGQFGRCNAANPAKTACAAITSSNAGSGASLYPDVPYDLNCTSGKACLTSDPTFWSTAQLTGISTYQWTGSAYTQVDGWTFKQSFPGTGDGTSPTLFLTNISHTGYDTTAGGANASVDDVVFGPTSTARLDNRVNPGSTLPAITRQRIGTVTTETGAVITVAYELAAACTSADQANPATNTGSCYPVWWTPAGQSIQKDWFNKYQVASVIQSDTYGGSATADTLYTGYKYLGGAAWHFDDNELVKAKYRTYGQFRGFGDVQTFTGQGNDEQTETETTYYRGMSDDNNTTAVTLTDSQGGQHDDTNQLAGEPLETTSYNFAGGPVTGSAIYSYWVSAAAATRTRTGLPDLTANATGQVEAWTRQALHSSSGTKWRETETDTSYYSSITSSYFGLPQYTYQHGDLSLTGNNQVRCTTTSYEPPSATGNIVGLPQQMETDADPCGGTSPAGASAPTAAEVNALAAPASVSRPADVVSDACTVYDAGLSATTSPAATVSSCPSAAPSKGDVSEFYVASGYASGAFGYQLKAASAYDTVGRVTGSWDGRLNFTQTAFTANSYGLTTGISSTNALGQVSSVTLDPLRGLTIGTSNINAITSTFHYDGLGRVIAEWANSRPISLTANATFTYNVANNGPSSVTSSALNDNNNVATSTTIYDSLLRVRQTQDPTPLAGRLVTDTYYDSRGWQVKVNNRWYDNSSQPATTLATVGGNPIPDSEVPDQTDTAYDGLGRPVLVTSDYNGTAKSQAATVYDQAVSDSVTSDGDGTITVALNGSGTPYAGAPATETVTDALGRTTQLLQYTTLPSVAITTSTTTPVTTSVAVSGGATQATDYGFNNAGQQTTVTDEASSQTWTSAYNMLGQVTSKTDPDNGATTGMTYDADGNLQQSTDALGKTISYTYDALNRKTAEYDAATSAQAGSNQLDSWFYDNSNNAVAGMPNAKGQLTTAISYVGGTSGSAYTEQAGGFTVLGEPTSQTITIPASEGALANVYKFTHSYEPVSGAPLKDIYPASPGGALPAETVVHGYGQANGLDLPIALAGLDSYGLSVSWTAFGQVGNEDIGASSTTNAFITNTYDPHTGALTDSNLANTNISSTPIDDTSYAYDPAGNPVSQTETRNGTTSETQCFAYDTLDRLREAWTATDSCAADPDVAKSSATVGDGIANAAYWTSWTFTPLGERSTETDHSLVSGTPDSVTQYCYNGNGDGQPDTLTSTQATPATAAGCGNTTPAANSTASSAYQFDANGQVTNRSVTTGTGTATTTTSQQLAWNDDGTLGSVTSNPTTTSPSTSSYVYDASGSLLLQKDPATGTAPATTILYLPGEELSLNTSTGAVTGTRFYALPGGGQVVRTGADPTTSGATPGYWFQLGDQHGTATLTIGPDLTTASATWREFTPYGAPRGATTSWVDNLGFLSKPADASTSLTILGARWYDPATGTFQSIDPIFEATSPQQHNGYDYSGNNPITGSDPSGQICDAGYTCQGGQDGAPTSGPSDPPVAGIGPTYGPGAPSASGNGTANTSSVVGLWVSPHVWVPVTSKYFTKMILNWAHWMRNMPGEMRYALSSPATEADAEFEIWFITCSADPKACPPAFTQEAEKLYTQGRNAQLAMGLALGGGGGVGGEGAGGDPGPWAADVAGDLSDIAAVNGRDDGVAIGDGLSCAASFAPSTEVLLASGKAVPISSLKPGDKVLATNTSTGKTSPETITAVEVNHDTDLYDLRVKTSHGIQVIHATSSHLFWDPVAHAWVKAASLKPGESLKTADGGTITADSSTIPANHDGWMWDLTIPGNNDHDFYVLAGGITVLVHNAACRTSVGNGLYQYADGSIRNAKGQFAGSTGTRVGAVYENQAWDMLENAGQNVIRRPVAVRYGTALRIYDGAIDLGGGNLVGLEVKSGTASLDANQKLFDDWIMAGNTGTGVGLSDGYTVVRVMQITIP
jgi:RHS repeat-associated protein